MNKELGGNVREKEELTHLIVSSISRSELQIRRRGRRKEK